MQAIYDGEAEKGIGNKWFINNLTVLSNRECGFYNRSEHYAGMRFLLISGYCKYPLIGKNLRWTWLPWNLVRPCMSIRMNCYI